MDAKAEIIRPVQVRSCLTMLAGHGKKSLSKYFLQILGVVQKHLQNLWCGFQGCTSKEAKTAVRTQSTNFYQGGRKMATPLLCTCQIYFAYSPLRYIFVYWFGRLIIIL